MTKSIQFRRGSTTEHALFTGLEGEITVDTTKKTAIIHDNITAGGIPLAREDLSNIPMQKIVDKGIAKSNMENVSCEDIANRNIAKQDLSNVSKGTITSKGIMSDDCSNATQLATETNIGPTQFATEEEALNEEINDKALTPKNATKLVKKYVTLPKDYISGFKITKISESSIQIDCGEARSEDNKYNIKLTEPIIKNINSIWEAGSNFGGLEENTTISVSKKYYVFAIAKEDETTDIIISDEEIDLTQSIFANLDYIAYKKIGSFKTDDNMYINEISIIYPNDSINIDTTESVEFIPNSTYIYTVPFDGTAFYLSGLRGNALTNLYLNNNRIAVFEGTTSGHTRSSFSFKVRKGDVIDMQHINDITRNSSLYVYKERTI